MDSPDCIVLVFSRAFAGVLALDAARRAMRRRVVKSLTSRAVRR
jgi:hypothetical protein